MDPKAQDIRSKAKEAKWRLEGAQAELARMERDCEHNRNPSLFTQPKYDPIIHPGGYSPGDPPGTMGIDRQLPCSWPPCSWPETREDRWTSVQIATRECTRCGKVETTTQTKEHVSKTPVFR